MPPKTYPNAVLMVLGVLKVDGGVLLFGLGVGGPLLCQDYTTRATTNSMCYKSYMLIATN